MNASNQKNPMDDSLPPDENKIIAERRLKLASLRAAGPAFPNDFKPDSSAAALHAEFDDKEPADLEALNHVVKLAGRMMLRRGMGKASFASLKDNGSTMQIYVQQESVGEEVYAAFKKFDLGDILGVEGSMFKTRTGELTIKVTRLRLLVKSLRPLPDKFHGLADQEIKYRQRYLGLIADDETRKAFLTRSSIIAELRRFFADHAFLEVETPMLHPIPGGAAARPFKTHHNALDMQMFLRIAPELYLKRLVVGGFDRVFEINRNFRNEGTSPRHNPEFTMLEFYAAYTDYHWLMDFVEECLRCCAMATRGTTSVSYQGRDIDFGKAFERLTIVEAIEKYAPRFVGQPLSDENYLRTTLKDMKVNVDQAPLLHAGVGALQLALFEEVAESLLWQPTFIIDYPVEVSPLARLSDTRPGITERFELFMMGREIANGFSELNDPEDQAERFRAQVSAKDAGDEEAMYYDADYIRALEYGMPPTGGCGIGVDRLVMLLADVPHIRDVLLFPHMRPEEMPGA
jgi:lysyl-tRNA synthetase class 2